MITLHRNGHPVAWEVLWLPDPTFGYERVPVRHLRVSHSAADTWHFTNNDGAPVTVYPDPQLDTCGAFPRPGHYALLVGDRVAGYLFLDPPGADARPADAIDGVSFGIRPDLEHPITEPLNAALEKISASGGGTLALGAGRYETGTVRMRSHTYLHLDAGAVLQASLNLDAHPLDAPGLWPENLPPSLIPGSRRRLISFHEVEHSGLLGPGVICGQGSELRRLHPDPRAMMQVVRAVDCRHLRFEGVTLRDSEFWSTHLLHCEDVTFRSVKLLNEIPPPGWDSFRHPGSRSLWNNADGINPDSSRRITIERCFFHTGDDCVPIKNTGCYRDRLADVNDITVRDCLMRSPVTALKIGTETRGGRIGHIRFEDLHIVEASRAIGLDLKDGAEAHDILFHRIHVRRCNRPFDVWVIPRDDEPRQTRFSKIRDVTIDDLRIERSATEGTNHTSHLAGRGPNFGVHDLRFRRLVINGRPVLGPGDMDLEVNEWVSGISWS
jgi:hypothetical protein